MFKVLLPLLLIGSNSFAAECFKAKDTSKMKASVYKEGAQSAEDQKVVAATLKKMTRKDEYSSTGFTKTATLKVKTDKGINATVGAFLNVPFRMYSVECDGGNMKLRRNNDGTITMTSDYIRADIDGCDGEVSIITPGTVFVPVQCKAI